MKTGDVLRLDRACSVQFLIPITVRVIRKLDYITYDGWSWIDAYQLDSRGEAITRRSLFIRPEFVEYVPPPPLKTTSTRRTTAARRPHRVG